MQSQTLMRKIGWEREKGEITWSVFLGRASQGESWPGSPFTGKGGRFPTTENSGYLNSLQDSVLRLQSILGKDSDP